MGIFFVYILKSSVCLVVFYLFYRLLLSRETFHRFNRVALLSILLLSCLLPLVEVTVEERTEVHQTMMTLEQWLMLADMMNTADATDLQVEEVTVTWIQVALLVYLAGILLFALRNGYSLLKLGGLLKFGRKENLSKYIDEGEKVTLIVHDRDIAPFSWMKYIVISKKDLDENGREILIHELAHIQNRHSWDLLVADICIFFQWFNPASWLLKQELQNIHEYEADETFIEKGCVNQVSKICKEKGLVGKRRKKQSPNQIAVILTRPFYAGYVLHKERIYKGNHSAIIDVETFNLVQKMMELQGMKFGKNRKLYFINKF